MDIINKLKNEKNELKSKNFLNLLFIKFHNTKKKIDIINKLKNEKKFALVAQLDRATDYGSVG